MGTSPSGSEGSALACAAVAGLAVAACASQDLQLPTPPDVESLRRVYDSPDGTIDERSAAEALLVAQKALRVLERVDAGSLLASALAALPSRFTGDGLPLGTGGYSARASGVVTVHRACDGWRSAPGYPGSLDLTGVIHESRFFGEVWGHAGLCKQTQTVLGVPIDVSIDGDVALWMDDPTTRDLTEHRWLVSVSGAITAGAFMLGGPTDFRVGRDTLEVRVQRADTTSVIVALGATGFTLRAANGTFGCNLQTYECSRQ
jgi:hypothetical protein